MASEMRNLAAQHRIPFEAKIPEYGRVTTACSVDTDKTLGVVFFGPNSYQQDIGGGFFFAASAQCLQKRIALFHHTSLLFRPILWGADLCKSY
tara:strand:- start:238 stop:516 length:279 start_codon:yes stop_codon:yes gene_type:complete